MSVEGDEPVADLLRRTAAPLLSTDGLFVAGPPPRFCPPDAPSVATPDEVVAFREREQVRRRWREALSSDDRLSYPEAFEIAAPSTNNPALERAVVQQADALDALLATGWRPWPDTVEPAGWRAVCPRCRHSDGDTRGTVGEAAERAMTCDCTPDTCSECPA